MIQIFFNNLIASGLSGYPEPIDVITVDEIELVDSFYWPQMLKSSDWPEWETTKDYFVLYSSDHELGGTCWGECDAPDFTNFVERGKILNGEYSQETPWMMRIPTSVSGLDEDTIFLYYHSKYNDPGNGDAQQTRLITSTGGVLHQAVWIDRGRPLGLEAWENHTGYCRVRVNSSGKFIADHLSVGLPAPITYISESTDGLSYARKREQLASENMPEGIIYWANNICIVQYKGKNYGFIITAPEDTVRNTEDRWISIVTVDDDFLPTNIIATVSGIDNIRTLTSYQEGNMVYLYYKGGDNSHVTLPTKMLKINLRNLLG